jgi:hypothetical protein
MYHRKQYAEDGNGYNDQIVLISPLGRDADLL